LTAAHAFLDDLSARVRAAAAAGTPLRIRGGGSKDFYGGALAGEPLDTGGLAGIVDYEPTELVLTARAGTPLAEVEAALAERGQMLAFEPPHFGPGATLGGAVACGLGGPRAAYAGRPRDFVLGVRMVDGRGRPLRFGGTVMKNVAGYDVSRLMAGAVGVLGVLTEVSLKVLPVARAEATLAFDFDQAAALDAVNRWGGQPLPLSGSAWRDGRLWLRLSGAEAAVDAAVRGLGGKRLDADDARAFWQGLREQTDDWFAWRDPSLPLLRVALPSTAPPLALGGDTLVEWGGAQRWLASDDLAAVQAAAKAAGGHAMRFRGPQAQDRAPPRDGAPQPRRFLEAPDPLRLRLHRRLKQVFDPHGVFNPGRLYPDL